jgi:hypothetical protein
MFGPTNLIFSYFFILLYYNTFYKINILYAESYMIKKIPPHYGFQLIKYTYLQVMDSSQGCSITVLNQVVCLNLTSLNKKKEKVWN